MLNFLREKPIDTQDEPAEPARHTSSSRKQLRWLIENPPADLAKLMTVDSDMAEVMLERNQNDEWKNRPHSDRGQLRYIRSMKQGWKLTGEPIIFSKSGNLLNGQNRLMACVKAGASFQTLVVFGIDDDAFKFMDIGIARSAGHIFAIEDIPNYNAMSAAARVLYAYYKVKGWSGGNIDVENDDLLSFYHDHERLQNSYKYGAKLHKELRLAGRWSIFCHYICAQKSRQLADDYFDALATGAGITAKSATFAVRKRLLASALSTSERLSDVHASAFIIKGWNAVRDGRQLGVIKWRTEQSPDEAFPRAI
jgi:hypothetical protein